MKRTNSFWITAICVVLCLLGTVRLLHTKPVHAQQNTGETYTGEFYLSAYIDVDGAYNAYATSAMQSDDSIEAEFIGLDAELTQDAGDIAYDSDSGYEEIQFSFSADGPVTPGHYYGTESDGYSCYNDDEEGTGDGDDCDEIEYVASAYASVYVEALPYISKISPSSVNQGDTGTLTISGSNLVINSADQLTINYSGSGMPFTLTGTPSSTTATFSYNFSGYDTGTYQISVTNNEGTSNSVNFTVNPPQYACTQSRTPNAVTLTVNGLENVSQGGTFTVSHSTTIANNAATTVSYGPYSTSASVASSIASAITRKYIHYGITAQSNGPQIIVQSRSMFGNITASPGSGVNIGTPTAVSCLPPPTSQLCDGTQPDYDTPRSYGRSPNEITETPRAHIIRRHIVGAPSLSPFTTQYLTLGITTDQKFFTVQNYNINTFIHDPIGADGVHKYRFPTHTFMGYTFGYIGVDATGNDLQVNNFYLDFANCRVNTSYPSSSM